MVAHFALLWTIAASAGASAPPAGFADIVERNLPSVVRVITTGSHAGEGSGVAISNDGLLVTNFHVVAGAKRIRVQFHDGRELDANLVAGDAPIDLAVLKIDGAATQAITFGDSTHLRIGEYVIAIGNPFGVGTTVTQGIVSAMSPSRLGVAGDEDYIQTDAAVNPGNSGGPLLNTRGELVGINTAILSASGGSNGIGFALPSNVVAIVARELIEKGHFERGYLGVAVQPMTQALAEAFGIENGGGAVITDVAGESPAARNGLQKGDVIVGMNGRPVRDFNRLRLFIAEARPAVATQLDVVRDGTEKTYWIVLEKRPAASSTQAQQTAQAPVANTTTAARLPGATIQDLNDKLRRDLAVPTAVKGVVLTAVDPESASAEGGLQAGDVVVGVNRTPVADSSALRAALLASSDANRALLLEVNRQGATFFFAVNRR